MSKNVTRGANVNSKATAKSTDLPRKTTKSLTTINATATTGGTNRQLKKQSSEESERTLRNTSTAATHGHDTTSKRPPLHNSKNKDRELVVSKRATPSPTAKATAVTLRAGGSKQPPGAAATKHKPNAVLDTYHNVTVASPPQKRKVQAKQTTTKPAIDHSPQRKVTKQQLRARTLSRTLEPDEIVILKRESAKKRIEREIQQANLPIKDPIAFEVTFETAKKESAVTETESDNYSDDFESYESDFETYSSTQDEEEEQVSENAAAATEDVAQVEPAAAASQSSVFDESPSLTQIDDDEEDSEPTQNPITVIHRDKEHERKLDSGHYDMNMRRHHPRLLDIASQSTQQKYDSFDTFSTSYSEQLDSGISSYGIAVLEPTQLSQSDTYYGGYADFVSRPVITRRGLELMRKLRFDQLHYQHFDMKPLSYESYMQSYGKLNTCQVASQTQSQHMHSECQTTELDMRNSWTQHPPHYISRDQQMVLSCSGESGIDVMDAFPSKLKNGYAESLARLRQLHQAEQLRAMQQQRQRIVKPTDFERLNVFLHNASLLLDKVLNINAQRQQGELNPLLKTPFAIGTCSLGYIPLQTSLLSALRVRRIFGSAGQQLVVTVHECPPQSDVYREDFANLLMVWSVAAADRPLRLLSTWAEVCRVEFSIEAPDIIVAGLRDGSVAMWDLRETYTYCSKLDGHLTHFAATQSVVPNIEADASALDLGAVVDVRSFRSTPKTGVAHGLQLTHKAIQYATLNDSGLLTIWTLVEQVAGQTSSTTNEYSSPWARVKLLQSAICNLRSYMERRLLKSQSNYDKTKCLFQGNIYSDKLLRELNETETTSSTLQGLRFTSIDTGCERIYVCTNRNFVLSCTKSLKMERFVRFALNESRFLFPTALCVLSNEDFLAVGLSNGSVMILNCNQRQRLPTRPMTTASKSSYEAAPTAALQGEIGKSCAIQNIILNERRSYEESDMQPDYDMRPNTAACLELIRQPRRAYELRVYDQQLLLSGSALREHLVQALVLSSDGWRLFALANGAVRIYDFHLDKELEGCNADGGKESNTRVADIAVACSSAKQQNLLLLRQDGKEVQLHTLN